MTAPGWRRCSGRGAAAVDHPELTFGRFAPGPGGSTSASRIEAECYCRAIADVQITSQLGPMGQASKRLCVLVLAAACAACQPAQEPQVRLSIGMLVSDLNAELAKLGRGWRLAKPGEVGDWLGANGPLSLDVRLSAGTLHVPVSEHGGLQLVTSRDDLNFIQADVAPQPLDSGEAHRVAERLCGEARKAGLTIPLKSGAEIYVKAGNEPICSLQDGKQILDVWIDRFQLEENGRYRVLLSVGTLTLPNVR